MCCSIALSCQTLVAQNPNAQAPWKLNGSNADSTKFVGTTNNVDLIFKRNYIEGFRLLQDTATKFMGDVYLDKFRIHPTPPPSSGPIKEARVMTMNSVGQIALSNFTLRVDDTFVCLYTAPWVFADGTSSDDDIALCPNFKSVTIGGDFTVSGLTLLGTTHLGTTGIGTGPNSQNQLSIVSVNKTAGIELLNLGTSSYGIKNRVNNNTITAYSVTDQTTNQDVFRVMGDGSINVRSDISQNIKSFSVTDIVNNEDVFKVMSDGTTYATKVIVQETPFPDYVFESNYKLIPINELEKYIVTNKHLPNMPNAKEVEENGADLGEINRLLVEKIEELTLYIIEQDKRIQKLEYKK